MRGKGKALGLLFLGIIVAGGGLLLLRGLLDPYRLPGSDWRSYQRQYISRDGRVIDTGNENISHSEGQGYGLLLAVAYKDRRVFDRIWSWTQKNLQTRSGDKLLSWKWAPDGEGGGAVQDPNNASDGDLLVAWALMRAHGLWEDFSYQQAAMQILTDLERLNVVERNGNLLLLPGTDGFQEEEGVTVNPSYYVFPALAELAAAFPGSPWKALEEAGYELIAQARFGKWSLAPDWAAESAEEEWRLAPQFPPTFGYNAVRVPLNIGWRDPQSELMQPFALFWEKFPGAEMPATVNLKTDAFGPHPALPGMQTLATFTRACAENRRLTVRALPELKRGESYFSASLNLLTKVAVRESFSPQ